MAEPSAQASGAPAAELLLPELRELTRQVHELLDSETAFRKANRRNFEASASDRTTQLLLAASERLFEECAAMDRASFEDHSARLGQLCKHFGTTLDMGLPEEKPSGIMSSSTWQQPQQATAASAMESRNIVLKDSYIIFGALFCMVIRAPTSAMLPAPAGTPSDARADGSGDSARSDELAVDTTVPTGLSPRLCQGIFKALCVKGQLVCKSFDVMKRLGEARTLVVHLTPELLSRGTVPAFCATATARRRAARRSVVLVDCGCSTAALQALERELSGATFVHFFAPPSLTGSNPGKVASERDIIAGGSVGLGSKNASFVLGADTVVIGLDGALPIDVTMCMNPLAPHKVCDRDHARIRGLVESLNGGSAGGSERDGTVAVISGISQESFLHLCHEISHAPAGPLAYAMSEFHFPKCLACFSTAEVAARAPPVSYHSVSTAGSTRCTSLAGGTPTSHSTAMTQPGSQEALERDSSTWPECPGRPGDAATRKQTFTSGWAPAGRGWEALTPHVFLSLGAFGVVSGKADCVLLEPDLACLGRALGVLDRRLPCR